MTNDGKTEGKGMANSIDQAYERLLKIRAEIEAAITVGPNEADTRLKVLDRILFEVLEWRHEAVFTEPPTPSGYIDYLLTIGERRGAMVIDGSTQSSDISIDRERVAHRRDHPIVERWHPVIRNRSASRSSARHDRSERVGVARDVIVQ
jgi:hypothetical protein